MRNLYVVTHPEATHHTERLIGGWHDSALTPRGLRDAHRLAVTLDERISAKGDVALFASDLQRTRQTAAPIAARLGVDVVVDADLRERSYGVAEGMPAGSMPYLPPPPEGDRMHHHDGVDGSESRFEWASRAYAAFERVLASAAQDTVVVTHGGTATYLIAAWIGLPIEAAGYVKFAVSAGGITHLREDDVFHDRQVVTLNSLDHLD